MATANSESDEEQIFVTREEEQLDPEAEADFDQAFERMMAESLDSRKFERKAVFDVPLPIRRGVQRESSTIPDEHTESPVQTQPNTMAFALMTKKGNRQQVCGFDRPFYTAILQLQFPYPSEDLVVIQ